MSVPKIVKKVSIIAVIVFLAVFALTTILNCAYTVNEQEAAVVLTFGEATDVKESGLNFKIPFIQRIEKVPTVVKGFAIGYDEATNQTTEDATMITNDYNFVNVDFFVDYKVSDPIKVLFASTDPVSILKTLVQAAGRSVIGVYGVDDVLTSGKSEIQANIKEIVDKKLDELDIGIQLVNLSIQDTEPPTAEVVQAFKAVEDAKQHKETALNDAKQYSNEKIPAARAEADKILQNAEAYKQSRINDANGQVARFNEMYAEYIKYPMITKKRMFYEAMEEIMPNLEVVIEGNNGSTQKVYPIKSLVDGTMKGDQ